MEQSMIESATQQGIWAVLFISLYLYQLREGKRRESESKTREEKLTDFISEMLKQFEGLSRQYENISDDVQEIKSELIGKSKKAVVHRS
ncbi:BhlA/UviB family holin-like peptide [Cohnella cholangitidis]|uniref:BhlA-like holin n=1 Tax=Cohnella cholangitidis TaxID=2598458 RepID=A0A7G5BY11_9BACL|nr:BhlA/UviB family holin-like peptide [Cohnella cholangitidis]QMV41845.1 hypothetical protein FPL14_12110 [Cohnella cholangitidis]